MARSPVTGGTRPKTQARYKAVFDKFQPFAVEQGVRFWNDVSARLLERYAAWLDGEGYAYRTEFLELTTIKQAVNWMIDEKHLPETCRIRLPLTRPTGTDTYCWRPDEVEAILERCNEVPELAWLGDVLTALACTGMRISELAGPALDRHRFRQPTSSSSSTRRPRWSAQRGRQGPADQEPPRPVLPDPRGSSPGAGADRAAPRRPRLPWPAGTAC